MSRGIVRGYRRGSLAVLATLLAACAAGEVDRGVRDGALGSARQELGGADAGDAGAGVDAVGLATGDAGVVAAENDCCSTGSSAGCNDEAVLACVCEGDEFCCSTEYDGVCVSQAQSLCGLTCDTRAPESDCCAPSDVPGCTQAGVEACICGIDPFCCIFRFDESCVNLAAARCAGGCAEAAPAP